MKTIAKKLEGLSLIDTISDTDLEYYLKSGQLKLVKYKKNSIIHFDSEKCLKVEILVSGRVVVNRIDEDGNLLNVTEFIRDDLIGGNLIFSKNPYYPMTVETYTDSELLEIDKNLLFMLLSENVNFLRIFLELISDNAMMLGDKIKHYVSKTIRQSLLSYFDYESKKQNTNIIKLNITKKALAEKIGVSRTSISRELAKMKAEALIDYYKNQIKLLYLDSK